MAIIQLGIPNPQPAGINALVHAQSKNTEHIPSHTVNSCDQYHFSLFTSIRTLTKLYVKLVWLYTQKTNSPTPFSQWTATLKMCGSAYKNRPQPNYCSCVVPVWVNERPVREVLTCQSPRTTRTHPRTARRRPPWSFR